MTSTRLTQQNENRSREWAAALRAAIPTDADPHRPLPATRGTAPTPDPTRPTSPGWPRTRPTHAHGWAGGCCVVGAPTRPPLGPASRGPRDRPKGRLPPVRPPFGRPPPPRYRTRSICRADNESGVPPSAPKPCLPIPCESIAGRATRIRPRSPPSPLVPLGPNPPSTRAATREGKGTRAPLPTQRSTQGTTMTIWEKQGGKRCECSEGSVEWIFEVDLSWSCRCARASTRFVDPGIRSALKCFS
jgi:hypothetical protein